MSAGFRPAVYAIDFGTTNSLIAAASADEVVPPLAIDPGAPDATIFRSILFAPDARTVFFGHAAIREYVDRGMEGRLLRSIKRHLASHLLAGTRIDGRPFRVEDLVGAFLREMRVRANRLLDADVNWVVLGRPARFADDDANDALANRRLEDAARIAGFTDVRLSPEPVAAAREFRRNATSARVALVADLGGGTSDFTVVRIGPAPFRPEDVLAIGGVVVAGDAFDASIMRHGVARHFGSEVTYRVPFGKNVLSMPPSLVERLCSPADLSILQRGDIASFLDMVRRGALGPGDRQALDRLQTLASDALGFAVFESIERAKRGLSTAERSQFAFDYPTIEIDETIERKAFETWSRRETERILATLDRTVAAAGLRHADVDVVCCTGGTAKVPALAIEARFGRARVEQFKSFHSVVEGLAQEARDLAAAG